MRYKIIADSFYSQFGRAFKQGDKVEANHLGDAEHIKILVGNGTIAEDVAETKPEQAEPKPAKPEASKK